MKTAIIYARYSCSSQTEQSIEGQMTVCNQFAANNDVQIVGTYIDRATTGTNDNRVEFQRMLTDSAKATWDIVLVYAIDRFGRNSIEVAINKQRLQKNNKILISATQRMSMNIDGTKNLDGIILENVMIGVAEYYSAELSQKILRGQNETRKKGLFCGGGLCYGYKVIDRKIYIDEETSKAVLLIFEQYSVGATVSQISKLLASKGYLRDGKPFTQNGIYNILKNEKYAGIFRHKGEAILNIYPPLIPDDIYTKVRKKVEKNKYGGAGRVTDYLLHNKVKCGYCGHPINGDSGTSKTGKIMYYYTCSGRKRFKNNCEKTRISKDALEEMVIKAIKDKLSQPKELDAIVNHLLEVQNTLLADNYIVSNLKKQLKDVDAQLNNIVEAIANGIRSKTTNQKLNDLETLKEELEKNLVIEQSKTVAPINETKIREFFEKALHSEKKMLINLLIKEVILYNDKIEIKLNSPIKKSPDESQGFCFSKNTFVLKEFINTNRISISQKILAFLLI